MFGSETSTCPYCSFGNFLIQAIPKTDEIRKNTFKTKIFVQKYHNYKNLW